MYRKIPLFVFLSLFLLISIAYAEPTKSYPTGWNWGYYNIPYVLSEYDKIAEKPGCIEWLNETPFVGTKRTHEFNCWDLIPAAKRAGWIVEQDYRKPVPGAIAYHDINPGVSGYAFSFKLIRAVEDNIVTLEAMNNEGNVVQWKVPIEKMQFWGKMMFKGYIYPKKE